MRVSGAVEDWQFETLSALLLICGATVCRIQLRSRNIFKNQIARFFFFNNLVNHSYAILGWFKDARSWASRLKRVRAVESACNPAGILLMSTERLSLVSRAK